ncbi:MAG: glycosyltransferase [Candidatus Paraimprobicoccus trichonymphae]|uniref:Glycosyltransferase n=1 Tax=Candidatus Paraimprobicoccus trichonymphae TaxID=3033793 RepID=A0AA48I3R1_9FIRM|nr:MAG: glycosyltransferase [Candidatus Paraimprobicoccus trichonymphae]
MKNSKIYKFKISLIVPVYNQERFIERTLKSIEKQILKNFEVIIINDCSTDHSFEIIEKFINKNENFILINSEINRGVSESRNLGIKTAKGEYLAFLDGDDFISPYFLKKMYDLIVKNNSDISCCNYWFYYSKINLYFFNILSMFSGTYLSNEMLKKLVSDVVVHSYVWNKLFKKSLFTENNIEFPDMDICEDVIVVLKTFYFSKKISVTYLPLYFYNKHKESCVSSMNLNKIFCYADSYRKVKYFLKSKSNYKKYKCYHKFLGFRIVLSVFFIMLFNKNKEKLKFKELCANFKNVIKIVTS